MPALSWVMTLGTMPLGEFPDKACYAPLEGESETPCRRKRLMRRGGRVSHDCFQSG